jgi:hypothetical protein
MGLLATDDDNEESATARAVPPGTLSNVSWDAVAG